MGYRLIAAFNRFASRNYLLIKYLADWGLWTLAAPLAFALRLELGVLQQGAAILIYMALGSAIKAAAVRFFSLHRQSWRSVGVRDLYALLRATATVTLILLAATFLLSPMVSIPRSVPFLDGTLGLGMLATVRLGLRSLHERTKARTAEGNSRGVLVVGAGEAGALIVREMQRHPEAGLKPIAFLDDDEGKQRSLVLGLPVLGTVDDLPRVVAKVRPHEVLIAMPSASGQVIRRVVALAREARVPYRIIPGMHEILSGRVTISHIREVDLEDLLRRDAVHLDLGQIAAYLRDRVVLVTGAAGSIGSEIVRQVARFHPQCVILLDRDESNLYLFERNLRCECPDLKFHTVVADIQRKHKMEHVFSRYRPQVVFHAAAHKHVPMMEADPDEAVFNNVLGTRNVLEMAIQYGVERFVNISTDKAVNPVSVMGASKRVAEYLVEQAAVQRAGRGECFVSVRFGNVLGSRGSVVPIFREQIRRGGPVTVTHPEMTRYFMSTSEAVQLVLQAAGLGENGAVYVLDMGEPVRIVDLARDLITLSGLEPEVDIPIEFTGLRRGEKLYEEVLTAEEGTVATQHEKIFMVRKDSGPGERFDALLEDLLAAAKACDEERIRRALKALVPTYQPDANGFFGGGSLSNPQ